LLSLNSKQQDFVSVLWTRQANSRSTAARVLHLSKPTASTLAKDLLSAGIIDEIGTGHSSGGKPPRLLRIHSDAFHTIGIDIGYSGKIYGIRMDATGKLAAQESMLCDSNFDAIVYAITTLAQKLRTPETVGIGIAISGIVNPITGNIFKSANFDLSQRPLLAKVQEQLHLPVLLDNRSRTSAFAEHFRGAVQQENNFILLSLGKSIGSAFFLHGQPYLGQCRSGEISELRLSNGQTLEACMRPENIIQHGLTQTATLCANGLAPLFSILDPRILVLSGRFSKLGADFEKNFSHLIQQNFHCQIIPAAFGQLSAAFGAAAETTEKFVLEKLYVSIKE